MYRYTLELAEKKDRRIFARIAAEFGLYAKAGAGAGQIGAFSQVMRGIVQGEYKIVKVEKDERESEVLP